MGAHLLSTRLWGSAPTPSANGARRLRRANEHPRGQSRHALEHLATTDRGVIMTRNSIRRGIQAVQGGENPEHVLWQEGQVVPTFANHTVILAPLQRRQKQTRSTSGKQGGCCGRATSKTLHPGR